MQKNGIASLAEGVFVVYSALAYIMEEQFYIIAPGKLVPQGPLSRDAIQAGLASGELNADFSVRRAGDSAGEWVPLREVMLAAPPCPPSYMAWSIFSVFCCFPFSVIAVTKSAKVADLHGRGLYAEAQAASRSAFRWNVFFTISVVLLLIFCFCCFKFCWEVWQDMDAAELDALRDYCAR